MPLTDFNESPLLDVTIDGSNEIDVKRKVMIVGGGCGVPSHIKVMAKHSNKLVIIADFTKKSKILAENWKKGIPVEVIPKDCEFVRQQIGNLYEGEAELRITENMNYVFDWKFFQKDIYGEEDGVDEEGNTQRPDSQEMLAKVNLFNERLKKIPGVIETGILTQSDADLTVIMGEDFNQFAIQY